MKATLPPFLKALEILAQSTHYRAMAASWGPSRRVSSVPEQTAVSLWFEGVVRTVL